MESPRRFDFSNKYSAFAAPEKEATQDFPPPKIQPCDQISNESDSINPNLNQTTSNFHPSSSKIPPNVDTSNRPSGEPHKYAQASLFKNANLLGGKTEAERNSELLPIKSGKSIAAQEAKRKNFNQYPF